ncbi:ABC transporter permease [Oricola indica]|uniref:ABC transporter permease n=1 Tax=Oricola indica TaxID=2872591 RepID=UPI003CCBCAD3
MAEIYMRSRLALRRDRVFDETTRIQLVTAIVLLAAYEGIAQSGLLYQDVVPSLIAIVRALFALVTTGEFYFHLSVTVIEITVAFLIGTFIGVTAGICFGLWRLLGEVLDPWVHYLAPTPKIIFLPITVLFFGTGISSKIAMGSLSAFFPVAVATYAAMRLVRPVLVRVAKSFNATTWQTVRFVYLPSLVMPVISSMRIGLGATVIGVLLTEIKMSQVGLGNLIVQDYNFFRIPEMYSLLLVIFAVAWAGNTGMELLAKRLSHFGP